MAVCYFFSAWRRLQVSGIPASDAVFYFAVNNVYLSLNYACTKVEAMNDVYMFLNFTCTKVKAMNDVYMFLKSTCTNV